MKIVIFGSKGYLGQYFASLYPEALTPNTDIADQSAVKEFLNEHNPEIIINCAGKTGRPNVDWCEDNKAITLRSNVTGPLVLLDEALNRNIYLVHLGSGCIYLGDNERKGFSEQDLPNFNGSYYAKTKAWIDQILKDYPVLILRLRMPFDGTNSERNLISKLLKYNKVLDVQNSITYLPEFMEAAKQLISKKATGIYNMVNPGTISPYQIMEIYKYSNPNHQFDRIDANELLNYTKAGRSNCVLNTSKLEAEGIKLSPVKEVVTKALETIT